MLGSPAPTHTHTRTHYSHSLVTCLHQTVASNLILIAHLHYNKLTQDYAFLPSSDPAPLRIILEPPSSNGVYTVEEGANFVLTCEVDIYSYPQPFRASEITVFRVNASGITPIESN